ncbi:EFR1 family ferrodoxin [Clostridium sp. JNZ J1-5]
MKGAIVYFSGTGNTEFIAREFQRNFKDNRIDCDMIDITKVKSLSKAYDFYVFGACIHAEMFPQLFKKWIVENIPKKCRGKCIVFSTQAAKTASGPDDIAGILKEKGLKVIIKEFIEMPNNYYVVAFDKDSREGIEELKKNAIEKVKIIIDQFLKNKECINRVSKARLLSAKLVYKLFLIYSKSWAKKKLSVNEEECIKCNKCVRECPTGNINLEKDKITFNLNCISCQKCIHKCPVNAFRYKGRTFEQYKL